MNPFALRLVFLVSLFAFVPTALYAQKFPTVVIWSEPGVQSVDSTAPSPAQLAEFFPGAHIVTTEQLPAQLTDAQTRLLILPLGSSIPEAAWSAISEFLHQGGNLLVLGGRPFTRAAYHDSSGWHLRDYSTRFSQPMLIDEYQSTPGSLRSTFTPNPDFPIDLPPFSWHQAFSPIIHLSTTDLYPRGGSAGSLDVNLDALVWSVTDGRRLSAPILQIDHFASGFDGGRWIFLSAELAPEFYSSPEATKLLRSLADRALEGALQFSVRPTLPLYLPGEPIELETIFHSATRPSTSFSVQVVAYPEEKPAQKQSATISFPATATTVLPPPSEKGLHIIEARLLEGATVRAIYHSAYWIHDEAYLRSGPTLDVNSDYFTLDANPLAVVGTTYMSSEVQRLYFDHPNVYVWNSDFRLIHSAGINMLRTGWWTGWDKFCDETGRPYERTLRTLEAYLMTARKYGLPVQFNFFAFLPEVLGGTNPYLDPEAVRKQQMLVGSVVARFHDVPFLAWDLINEPSFSKRLWKMRPNGDLIELAAWNAWLSQKYPDRAALAVAWNVPPDSVDGNISVPSEEEFTPRDVYIPIVSLRIHDFAVFAQEKFTDWMRSMREVIRATGSQQPITAGQDEGGYLDRLNPSFFAPQVDFTTNHTWWQNDNLLWDSLVAKQPAKAMLIQETGVQRQVTSDGNARLTPEQEAALFERKLVLSFVYGSGAIQWLWNTNAYMTEVGETPIGALRADGTEKPEATVLRQMAKFAAAASPYLKNPKPPDIAIVTSQVAQYSVQGELQIEAQQNAVRALAYGLHQPCYIIAENQIDNLGSPKLVILPSAQALRESTWQALLTYVRNGGNLLVTGPVSRDEHWHLVDRYTPLGIKATTEPLTSHEATVTSDTEPENRPRVISTYRMSFDQQKQQLLEWLHFSNGSTFAGISLDHGKLYWSAYPLELAENHLQAWGFYKTIADVTGIKTMCDVHQSPGAPLDSKSILVYPISLERSILYVIESEYSDDVDLLLHDTESDTGFNVHLPAQRAALALIDKRTKKILAKYGF